MRRKDEGLSIIELLVGLVVSMVVLFAVLSAYSQANSVKSRVQGAVKIQGNVRLAMDRLSREMRMAGFAVPGGFEMKTGTTWSPAVFHASQTEIGFRADIDGGGAEIVCTPDSTNTDCPLSKLRLDAVDYFQALDCDSLDGSLGGLKLVADMKGDWLPFACTGFSLTDNSIYVSNLPDGVFEAGTAHVSTIEQIYYRYVPSLEPPYGRLLRQMRYGNTPDDTFPPRKGDWIPVADHLTDFWIVYQDFSGAALRGNPLTPSERIRINRAVISMEGYDRAGPDGRPQLIRVRSAVHLRNR